VSGALRLRLRRFLLDDEVDEDVEDVEVGLVTELGLDDRTVVKRHHRYVNEEHKSTRHESRVYATAAAAARALEKSIKTLEGKGYLEDEPVEVEVDLQEAAAARADAKAVSDPLRVVSDECAVEFARAWSARGYKLALTFVEECRGRPRGTHPAAIAAECLELAEACFGVTFARRTRSADDEHGAIRRVGARQLHEFYEGPLAVAALAQHRLERGGGDTDDADVGGGLARMRRLLLPTA
jgi:hypothetical protein